MKDGPLKLPRPVLLTVLTAGVIFLFFTVPLFTFLYHPPSSARGEPTEIIMEIPQGVSLRKTGDLLFGAGLISNVDWFVAAGKIFWIERQIKPGEYSFRNDELPVDIIARLRAGDVIQYPLTIPEGFSLKQIAEQVAENGLAGGEEFLDRAMAPDFAASLALPGNTLEGYVYPDSYLFTKDAGVDAILQRMVARFKEVFNEDMKARAGELGMTLHEVVTLASIIEKETGVAEERRLISAVFHNRLQRGIRLQSDPTVIYAIPGFDGNLTRRHLKLPSPYNTYYVRGLPPGPIASPGKGALMAALYPEEADYLYFVSRNDGTHHFSKTLSEHNRAVDKYQRRRGRKST